MDQTARCCRRSMRVSISVTNFSWPSGPGGLGAELVRLVRAADQAGVDTVWVADHLIQADPTAGPDQTEMLEAYTTLGFLAAQTQRVRLGTMVSPAALRPPALLVKTVTTLDALSGGRAWLGIARGTTPRRRRPWTCRCLRWPNDSSGWRRRCRSPPACGRGTRRRSRASTTGCGIRSTAPDRHSAPIRRS